MVVERLAEAKDEAEVGADAWTAGVEARSID